MSEVEIGPYFFLYSILSSPLSSCSCFPPRSVGRAFGVSVFRLMRTVARIEFDSEKVIWACRAPWP